MAGLIERYRDRLPVSDRHAGGHAGRGRRRRCCPRRGSPRWLGVDVYLKYEGANPTGSFKDRGMTVAVSKALEDGATRGGLRVDRQHVGVGGRVLRPGRHPPGGRPARGRDRARQARPGPDLRRARDRDPGGLRRRAAARARAGRAAPDRAPELGQPVPARGPEDGGVRGARAARRRARLGGAPRRQRRQHHRLLEGLRRDRRGAADAGRPGRGRGAARARAAPVPNPQTVATAIRIGNPARLEEAMAARVASRTAPCGRCPTTRILAAYRLLAQDEGVFCEPASAASVAALIEAVADGLVEPGSTVVCVLTGHGLKDPDTAGAEGAEIVRCPPDVDSLEELAFAGRRSRSLPERMHVTAPASSANLGPGFDCLAVALELRNEVVIGPRARGWCQVTRRGRGRRDALAGPTTTSSCGRSRRPAPIRAASAFAMRNRVPFCRGLGSSAATIAAGVVAGLAWAGRDADPLPEAAALEGHPDNVAAALLGGLTLAWNGRRRAACAAAAPCPVEFVVRRRRGRARDRAGPRGAARHGSPTPTPCTRRAGRRCWWRRSRRAGPSC